MHIRAPEVEEFLLLTVADRLITRPRVVGRVVASSLFGQGTAGYAQLVMLNGP